MGGGSSVSEMGVRLVERRNCSLRLLDRFRPLEFEGSRSPKGPSRRHGLLSLVVGVPDAGVAWGTITPPACTTLLGVSGVSGAFHGPAVVFVVGDIGSGDSEMYTHGVV